MNEELIISDSCIGCGRCTQVCIRGHIQMGDDKRPHEIESRYSCFRCGQCMAICPKSAIRLREFQDFVPEESVPSITADELQTLFRHRRSCRWFDRKCTKDEIQSLVSSAMYAPTAENSQSVEFVVIDEEFDDFMRLCASILKDHVDEHPRLKQFVEYVENGSEGKNNPFTWEGRQLIISFARSPSMPSYQWSRSISWLPPWVWADSIQDGSFRPVRTIPKDSCPSSRRFPKGCRPLPCSSSDIPV